MEVILCHFQKKVNSTKQALEHADSIVHYECTLKEGTSIYAPRLVFAFGTQNAPTGANYAVIPTFLHRGYFVVDWVFNKGLWEVQLKEDCLASFKNEIGDATCYILRSNKSYNLTIADMTYPSTTQFFYGQTNIEVPWQKFEPGAGCYVFGCVGAGSNKVGAVSYYAASENVMQQLMSKLFANLDWANINWDDVGGIPAELVACLINPAQYIVSCKWYPFSIDTISASGVENVKIGFWDIGVGAYKMTLNRGSFVLQDARFPANPEAKAKGDYIYFEPYSSYRLFAPPFGLIELNRSDFRSEIVACEVLVDFTTGGGTLNIYGSTEATGAQYLVKTIDIAFGVDIPLATSAISMQGLAVSGLSNAVGNLASSMKELAFGSTAGEEPSGNMFTKFGDAVSTASTTASVINSTASFQNFMYEYWYLIAKYTRMPQIDIQNLGAPCFATHKIGTLGGYIVCAEADIDLTANNNEAGEIRRYMTSGFWYE